MVFDWWTSCLLFQRMAVSIDFVAVDKKSIPNDENKSYFSQVLATFIKVGATTFTRVAKYLAHQGTVIIFG